MLKYKSSNVYVPMASPLVGDPNKKMVFAIECSDREVVECLKQLCM